MKHMKRALLVATALIGLGAAAPAPAKETARLALFPAHPRAGRLTTVQLRPYLYLGGTDLRPRLAIRTWSGANRDRPSYTRVRTPGLLRVPNRRHDV